MQYRFVSVLLSVVMIGIVLAGCQARAALPAECPEEINFNAQPEEPQTTSTTETDPSGLPIKRVKEGERVTFPNLNAQDPDGDTISYSFSFPFNEEGEWQTSIGDAGEYVITITASDGTNDIVQYVKVIVEAANAPPVITVNDEITVREGETIDFRGLTTDPDGDSVSLSVSGWISDLVYDTSFNDAGEHEVILTASDGVSTVSKTIRITVENVNRAPTIEPIRDIFLNPGDRLEMDPVVSDPDGDEVSIEYSVPFNSQGIFVPEESDEGTYRVTVTVSDGSLSNSVSFFIAVERRNEPPTLSGLRDITVEEGDTVILTPRASDPDGDEVTVTYTGWMTDSTRQTGYDDAGEYTVTVTASDGELETAQSISVTVLNKNRPPVFGEGAFN